MNTIARLANLRIADETAPLAQLIVNIKFADIIARLAEADAAEDLLTCELGGHRVEELFLRRDNRDGQEIFVCETCANEGDVSPVED